MSTTPHASKVPASNTKHVSTGPGASAVRPAVHGSFHALSADVNKGPWEPLAQGRDDGKTKNYSVPPELIELARANRAARGQAGKLTPLVPKPDREVDVVVPPAPAPQIALAAPPEEGLEAAPSAVIEAAPSGVIEAPSTVIEAAEPAASSPSLPPFESAARSSPLRGLVPIVKGALFIGAYVLLCYYGALLMAGAP